jgi:hypothetical protein
VFAVHEQPLSGVLDAVGGEGMELPDELAPDPNLRAARNQIRAVGVSIREALADDDRLIAGLVER